MARDHLAPDALIVARQYRARTGRTLDLRHPTDLSEKVQWLKLHDRSPLHTICADKLRSRGYVAARLGEAVLAPLLGVARDAEAVAPESIEADRFVVKTNHDQGGVHICHDRAAFDWPGVRADLRRRLAANKYYEFREHQYRGIPRAITVEDLLEDDDGAPVRELKVYCFHGRPQFVQLVLDRFANKREAFYDLDWRRLPMRAVATPLDGEAPRPRCLETVLEAAAALARPFLFVRVDFLAGLGARFWFGEITFHYGAGLIRFAPEEWDRTFGDLLDLGRLPESRVAQRAALDALADRPTGPDPGPVLRPARAH